MMAWVEICGDCGYHHMHQINNDSLFIYWNYAQIPKFLIVAQYDSKSKDWKQDSDSEDEQNPLPPQLKEILITAAQKKSGRHHVQVKYGNLFHEDFSFGPTPIAPKTEDNCIIN